MSYGAMIKNASGVEMQFGVEKLPHCLTAFQMNIGHTDRLFNNYGNSPYYYDTAIPYTNKASVAVSQMNNYGLAPTVWITQSPQGTIRVNGGFFHRDATGSVVTVRCYVMAPIPAGTNPAGSYGMAIWASDGGLAFWTGYPPAPLEIVSQGAGSFPYVGPKRAILPVHTGQYWPNTSVDGGRQWPQYYYALLHNRSTGALQQGTSVYVWQWMPSGTSSNAYSCLMMDTTSADSVFFGD